MGTESTKREKKHQQTKQTENLEKFLLEKEANKRRSKQKINYNVLWTIVYISHNACEKSVERAVKSNRKKEKNFDGMR